MIEAGSVLTLEVEKPAAGGRMLARHDGQVVLIWGAIPGERVTARIDRTSKNVAFGTTVDILTPSPDRRTVPGDWRCGGNVLAHVGYDRQRHLKGDIIRDAFGRIGRVPLAASPEVVGSPERGYRMRARLHARGARLGFYKEETHELCDACETGQLSEAAGRWVTSAQEMLRSQPLPDITAVEIAENIAGSETACHLDLRATADPSPYRSLATGLVGLTAQPANWHEAVTLAGTPQVVDVIPVGGGTREPLRLTRSVRAFFQGNRFLLTSLVKHVTALVSEGPIVDLYAGGGLFGLALAASGSEDVTLVEGDPVSGADLQLNARPFRPHVRVERSSVEVFLTSHRTRRYGTAIVDPPRTGLSRSAADGIVALAPRNLVYVSCDVATLARDVRILLDGGYTLGGVTGMDLFPNTAHVEAVVQLTR